MSKYPNLIKSLKVIADDFDSKGNVKYADVVDRAMKVIAEKEKTWEEMSDYEQKIEIWWDMYKDAYGIRPRGVDPPPEDKIDAVLQDLEEKIKEDMEFEENDLETQQHNWRWAYRDLYGKDPSPEKIPQNIDQCKKEIIEMKRKWVNISNINREKNEEL